MKAKGLETTFFPVSSRSVRSWEPVLSERRQDLVQGLIFLSRFTGLKDLVVESRLCFRALSVQESWLDTPPEAPLAEEKTTHSLSVQENFLVTL